MLFNKGLALGGAMLVAAIPGQSAALHAQSTKSAVSSKTSGGIVVSQMTVAEAMRRAAEKKAASKPAPAPTIVDTVVDVVVEAVESVVQTVSAIIAPEPVVVTQTVSAPTSTTTTSTTSTTSLTAMPELAATTGATVSVARVFTVSNQTELRAALTAAQSLAGAEIRLNPGNYGDLLWNSKSYPLGRVYIVPATSTKPVFRSIQANSSNNMSFHGLKVTGQQWGRGVQLNSSRNMSFTGSEISGLTEDGNPWDEGITGIQVRFSTNVVVQDNRFSDIRVAMYVQRSSDVSIRYNRMQNIREGFNIVATDQVQVRGNHFSHFYPRYDLGEHPDAIQLWTNGETVGSTRVRISENLISMGGTRAIQGLLSGCEAAGVRHRDWEVSRNVYYGSSVHGLSFNCVDGLKISNNVVVASPHADVNNSIRSQDGTSSGGYLPRIRVRTSTAVSAWNNVIMAGVSRDTSPVIMWDNWDLVDAMGWGGLPWTDIFAGGRPTAEAPALTAFITRNPSAAFTRNGGVTAPFVHGARSLTTSAQLQEVVNLLAN